MSVGETGFPENTWCASCPFILGVVTFGDRGLSYLSFFFLSLLFFSTWDFLGLVMCCEYRVPFFEGIPRSKVKLPVALSSVSLAKKQ